MKILWIFFFGGGGGHHRMGLYLGVISMHFRGYFLGLPKSQIFFGVLEIPDIFWG